MKRILFTALPLLAVLLASACSKESEKSLYDKQEVIIERFIQARADAGETETETFGISSVSSCAASFAATAARASALMMRDFSFLGVSSGWGARLGAAGFAGREIMGSGLSKIGSASPDSRSFKSSPSYASSSASEGGCTLILG